MGKNMQNVTNEQHQFYNSVAYAGIGVVMSCAALLLVYQIYWEQIGASPEPERLYLSIGHAIFGGASLIFILYEVLMMRAMQNVIDTNEAPVTGYSRIHVSLRWSVYAVWIVGTFFMASNGGFFASVWLTLFGLIEMAFESMHSALKKRHFLDRITHR